MKTFVVNAATTACCGESAEQCRCRSAAYVQPGDGAAVLRILEERERAERRRSVDQSDMLIAPTMNWTSTDSSAEREQERQRRQRLTFEQDLLLPTETL